MTTESIFLDEILSTPQDIAPRLVYADWLSERGDPRGEFIHLQCELADTPRGEPREFELRARERQLLNEHGVRWAARLLPLAPEEIQFSIREQIPMEFHAGFVECVAMNAEDFVERAAELSSLTPLCRLVALRNFRQPSPSEVDRLANCPHLARLKSLTARSHDLRIEGTQTLMASAYLESLRELSLPHTGIGLKALRYILQAESLGKLTTLDLSGNEIADSALGELAASPLLESVQSLNLSGNRVSAKGWAALFDSGWKFDELRIGGNKKSPDAGRQIASWDALAEVETLSLWSSGLDDAAACAVVQSPGVKRLRSLDLSSNKALTHKTIDALREANSMGGLRELNLSNCGIEEEGARSLAKAGALTNLTRLSLAMNKLGDNGVAAIVQSPVVAQVREIDLHVNRITDEGLTAIACSPQLEHLEVLNLSNNARITDAGLAALARSPHLKRLAVLLLGSNSKITLPGLKTLIESPRLPNLRQVTVVDFQRDRAIKEYLSDRFGPARVGPMFSCSLP